MDSCTVGGYRGLPGAEFRVRPLPRLTGSAGNRREGPELEPSKQDEEEEKMPRSWASPVLARSSSKKGPRPSRPGEDGSAPCVPASFRLVP